MNRQTFIITLKIYMICWNGFIQMRSLKKIKNIESDSPAENWQQEFLYVFEYILDNKKFVYNTYYSVSRALFLNFIYKQTNMLLTRVIDEKSKKIAVQNKNKKFIADFYKYAFCRLSARMD